MWRRQRLLTAGSVPVISPSKIMKIKKHVSFKAAFLVFVGLYRAAAGPGPADFGRNQTNPLTMTSPRYLEDHPELLRVSPSPKEAAARLEQYRTYLTELMANLAFSHSPRILEEYPELQRVSISAEASQTAVIRREKRMATLLKNQAWVNSPRAREEFPDL